MGLVHGVVGCSPILHASLIASHGQFLWLYNAFMVIMLLDPCVEVGVSLPFDLVLQLYWILVQSHCLLCSANSHWSCLIVMILIHA